MIAQLQRVSVAIDRHPIVSNIDMSIAASSCTAIVGHSGAGKTTVARVLAGLQPATTGSAVWAPGTRRSMLLQRPEDMFMTDSVYDEVAFAPALDGLAGAALDDRVTWALAAVGIHDELRHADPLHLAGGTQRLVAMAAALSAGPELLILDEPTAGVDQPGRWRIVAALNRLQSEGVAVVVVTHDMRLIAAVADHVVALRDGAMLYTGRTDELLASPAELGRIGLPVLAEVDAAHVVAGAAGGTAPAVYDGSAMIEYVAGHLVGTAGADA